ncbi:phosphate propanoyltransferase [Velocimicrobium porci]|uniref:Phosphate propanoyltransferase n=1 Tax=Velocimicrobium porci TaxID=2606634 RepID=A0A6L5Y1C6_9FIRM|nr:phosphate propanoyltransferase [Velocimicrobium porci]MSS64966.1 phosphate propanoyltransferase [Velocimicrobium porci]
MEQLVLAVTEAVKNAGLVQVEVSARHVHLSEQDFEVLFGQGKTLTPKRELSQIGQYLSEERVTLIGPKGEKKNVAVLGPLRKDTQIELSKSDCVMLGINAPVRESGDIKGSAPITIVGPVGTLQLDEGVIIAHKHVHVPEKVAKELGYQDKERVSVELFTERPVIYKDVILRVSDKFRFRMHIDFDEANAAGVSGFTLGKIIK